MENSFDCSSLFSQLDLQGQLSKSRNLNVGLFLLAAVTIAGLGYYYFRVQNLEEENHKLATQIAKTKLLANESTQSDL
jgi:uncharacterized protein HemX